jgi:hypothetical protein
MKKTLSLIIYCTLLFSTYCYSGFSISPITNDNFTNLTFSDHAYINGKVFFKTNNQLGVSDGTSSGTRLLTEPETVIFFSFQQHGEEIFFINNLDMSLWKSNGQVTQRFSAENTIASSTIAFNSDSLVKKRDLLFTIFRGEEAGENFLVEIKDSKIRSFPEISNVSLRSICQFNENNFLAQVTLPTSFDKKIIHYNNGTVEDLFTQADDGSLPFLKFDHAGHCFYRESTNLLKVDENGSVTTVQITDAGDDPQVGPLRFSRLNDQLYTKVANKIYQFDDSTDTFNPRYDVSVDFGPFALSLAMDYFITSDNNFYAQVTGRNFDPEMRILLIYDENFNLISRTEGRFPQGRIPIDIGNGEIPYPYSIDGLDYLLTRRSDEILRSYLGYTQTSEFLHTPSLKIKSIFGEEDNIFVIAEKKDNTANVGLYKLSPTPLVTPQLTGLWFNPNWQHQGLFITIGKRADDSVYLFASISSYQDGQPFWIAGNTDIDFGKGEISLDLFEFTSSSLLTQQQSQDQTIAYGQLKLTPLDCDKLQVKITPLVGDEIDIEMSRIDNASITGCAQ